MIDIELLEKAKDYGVIDVFSTYTDDFDINMVYCNLNIYLNWLIEYTEKYRENYCINILVQSRYSNIYTNLYFNYIKIAKLDIKDFNEYSIYLEERENIEHYNIIERYFSYLKNLLILKEDKELTYEEKYPKNLLSKQYIMAKKVEELFIKDNSRWKIKF